MTLKTLCKFLIFDRDAIVALAADRRAPWLGLFFVLGAALAREYDKESLQAEPWHLLLPLVASLLAALALYAVLTLTITFTREGRPKVLAFFPRFLGLFWLTAPLAWSYAVPYEQLLSEAHAAYANLLTLAVVALWRVLLMIRVVNVLYGVRVIAAVWPVMLFAVAAAFAALSQLDSRILAIMGGVRLNEAEQALRTGAFLLMIGSFYTSWIWALGTLVVLVQSLRKPRPFPPLPELSSQSARGPWILGAAVCGVLLLALPFTQPAQTERQHVERLLKAGDYEGALDLLCATPRDAFPRHWEPPPHDPGDLVFGLRGHPDLLEVTSHVSKRADVPPWVLEGYTRGLSLSMTHVSAAFASAERTPLLLETLLAWPDEGVFQPTLVNRLELGLSALEESEDPAAHSDRIALFKKVLARAKSVSLRPR